jgi:peptidoglycan/xylan/chitin deacetylase (PgdA/CDA1 family)
LELRIGDGTFANFFYLKLESDQAASVGDRYLVSGKWCRLVLPWGALDASTGAPARNSSAQVRLTPVDKGAGPVTVHFAGFGYLPESSAGYVSFTVDDGWIDQWNIVRPTLNQYGWPATVFPIVDLLGQSSYMTLQQLQTLQNEHNWEIGAHAMTVAHHNAVGGFTALSAADLDVELVGIKSWLLVNGFRGHDYFAYPQGLYNDTVIAGMRTYFAAARTQHGFRRETLPVGERHRTRSVNLGGTGTTLAQAQAMVDETVTNKEWLNFTIHKLGATLVDGSTWIASDFQALCAYIAGKGSAMQVRTYGQALRTVLV